MGLDMYLTKKTYIGNEYRKPEEMVKVVMPEVQEGATFEIKQAIKTERVSEISESVGYWRKANQIHKWFVDNVQAGKDNCEEHLVEWDKLMELLSICKEVKKSPKKAVELLPTRPGFFFGGTEYDKHYMTDIDNTIAIIEELVKEKGDNEYLSGDIYYCASW